MSSLLFHKPRKPQQSLDLVSLSAILKDNQPPRFQYCPAPIFRYPSTDSPVAVVHYTTPMATDNSSPNPINVTRILGLASGSTFPPGVHLIQYSASDATGNYAKCIFHIVVRGKTAVLCLCISIFGHYF